MHDFGLLENLKKIKTWNQKFSQKKNKNKMLPFLISSRPQRLNFSTLLNLFFTYLTINP